MSIAIALWSLEVVPGKSVEVVPAHDIRISNVALGDVLADDEGRTTLKFSFSKVNPLSNSDDEEKEDENEEPQTQTTVICSLTPGKIEQASTDIVLQEDESYTFELAGKNTIFLTGHYIDQGADQSPGGYDDFDDSDMDEEDNHDLRYVSSDVEMPPDGLDIDSDASRFEEIEDGEPAKNLKRSRDSLLGKDIEKSKAEKKPKKQKLEDGKSVATDAGDEKKKKDKKDKDDKKEKGADASVKELSSGLKIKDAKIGTGPMAKKGQTVMMRYIGKLQSGKIFDQNTKGKPFTFRLGQGEVIKGWDDGIVGMQVGGERTLIVPPNLGYGKKGTQGIPGNSTLLFEVKCVQIK